MLTGDQPTRAPAGLPLMSHPAQGPPNTSRWQRALNEACPANARHIGDAPGPVPVRARVVWERDGEEWVDGTAIRWDRSHVLVQINDRARCPTIGFWLRPQDVRRRGR